MPITSGYGLHNNQGLTGFEHFDKVESPEMGVQNEAPFWGSENTSTWDNYI